METQNYLEVRNNVVVNVVVWDGDVNTWTPPEGSTMLIQATTPAIVWVNLNGIYDTPNWVLEQKNGYGNIGFTWDGTVLTTNQEHPI